MKANTVLRLLSSFVWIDQYNECNGKTSFKEFMTCLNFLPRIRTFNYKAHHLAHLAFSSMWSKAFPASKFLHTFTRNVTSFATGRIFFLQMLMHLWHINGKVSKCKCLSCANSRWNRYILFYKNFYNKQLLYWRQ